MPYRAIQFGWDDADADHSRGGFSSAEEAWAYVQGFICAQCVADIKRGHMIEDEGLLVKGVQDTSCGSEWQVVAENAQTSVAHR